MHQIWKFPIKTTDEQTVEMPKNAKILTVQVQKGTPCIWAEVDTEASKVERKFLVYGTGHTMRNPAQEQYIGTYQQLDGNLIWHLYEDITP